MPAPVIDPTSSVLSYPQWLAWAFSFSASGTPYTWRVDSGALPPGMSLQPSWPAEGVNSTKTMTVTGSAFTEGTALVFSSLTGGSGLTASTVIYYVTNPSGATFQLAASPGTAAIAFGSDISAAQMYQPGLLTGAASLPGIYNLNMVATNASGDSAVVTFTIGIEAAAASPDTNADIVWDFATNNIIVQTSSQVSLTPVDRATPIFYVKEEDDFIARLVLMKNGTVLDVSGGTLSAMSNQLKLVLKEFEPESKIVISDGSVQVGLAGAASQLVHAQFSGDVLAGSLSNYEEDTGTFFNALAEFELTFPNPYGTIGGETLRRTSRTFTIQIERDLGEGS